MNPKHRKMNAQYVTPKITLILNPIENSRNPEPNLNP